MPDFDQQRHKPPAGLVRPRELIVACAPLRSNVNLSRIARTASCCGVARLVACGRPRIDPEIARDASNHLPIELHRTLAPVLARLRTERYQLVGLEQTTNSRSLYSFPFDRRTVLVVGNERQGLEPDLLAMLDQVVEIPVYGQPFSYNVASAVDMALYEYCRQFPEG